MWERWNSWTEDKGFGPVEMNSFNHYAYGAIGEWLYQRVCGIAPHPDFPGYTRAILAPLPGGGMSHGGGSLETRSGTFVSKWEVQGAVFYFQFIIPARAEAVIRLPVIEWDFVRLDGKPVPADMKQESTSRFSKCEMLVPAGEYHITVESDSVEG